MMLSGAEVRRLLNQVLRTDSDFEAFCIDAWPTIHQRFNDKMDRVARINLLFQLEDPRQVVAKLRAAYPEAIERLLEQLAGSREVAERTGSAEPPADWRTKSRACRRIRDPHAALRPPVLTVELTLPTEGELDTAYFLHIGQDLSSEPDCIVTAERRRFSQAGTEFNYNGLRGAEALNYLLNLGQEHLLEQHLAGKAALDVGAALFDILFPPDQRWQAVMRRLAGYDADRSVVVSPAQEEVRLRICTQEPSLLTLPWRLLAWRRQFLADENWTVEVVPSLSAAAKVKLLVPAKFLVVAPRCRGPGIFDLDTDRHLAALKASLTRFSAEWQRPSLYRVVESRRDLNDALRGMEPDIVYYYGHGTVLANQPCLLLGDVEGSPDPLPLHELRRYLRDSRSRPKIVFLNGSLALHSADSRPVHSRLEEVPLYITQRTTAYRGQAGAFALHFFQRCLIDGTNPVLALHGLDDVYSRADFQWCVPVPHTDFATFEVQVGHPAGPDEKAPLRLDRRERKAMVDDHVNALLRSQDHRVQALVLCASPGNLIEHFSWQCVDYLVHEKERRLLPLDIPFPTTASNLNDLLDDALRRQLLAKPGEDLRHALRRVLQPQVRLIWLNYGVLRPGPNDKLPLRKWLNYCCDVLVRHCPDSCRIMAYLGLALDESEHQDIASGLTIYQRELGQTGSHLRFGCDFLSPLPAVTQSDLFRFFDDPRNTSCPTRLSRMAAERVFAGSRGIYEQAVRLIEHGEARRWDDDYLSELDTPPKSPLGKKKKRSID